MRKKSDDAVTGYVIYAKLRSYGKQTNEKPSMLYLKQQYTVTALSQAAWGVVGFQQNFRDAYLVQFLSQRPEICLMVRHTCTLYVRFFFKLKEVGSK